MSSLNPALELMLSAVSFPLMFNLMQNINSLLEGPLLSTFNPHVYLTSYQDMSTKCLKVLCFRPWMFQMYNFAFDLGVLTITDMCRSALLKNGFVSVLLSWLIFFWVLRSTWLKLPSIWIWFDNQSWGRSCIFASCLPPREGKCKACSPSISNRNNMMCH